MAIVKMKRLRLLALESERDALLARLQHAGCVEVLEPEGQLNDPEWTALLHRDTTTLLEVKAQASVIRSSLEALKKYAEVKSGLFVQRVPVQEEDFFASRVLEDALKTAEFINQCTRQLSKLQTQETNLLNGKAGLLPWASLDLPLETRETVTTVLQLGTCPVAVELSTLEGELAQAAERAQLYEVSADKHQRYLLLVCSKDQAEDAVKSLRPFGYGMARIKGMTGTAGENIRRLEEELAENARQREELIGRIVDCKDQSKALEICQDRLEQELQKQQAREKVLTDGTMIFLEGWAAETGLEELKQELAQFVCAYDLSDPDPEDTPPTLLKNRKWISCINMVTEMYSLPVYHGGIDPNPLIFGFFVVFFGFMFADLAYGIVLFALSLYITKKYRPKGTVGYMFHLGQYLGISTAVFGALTGGLCGDAIYQFTSAFFPEHVISMPALINPLQDPMTIMAIALGMGVIHMLFGQCVHIYMEIRDGRPAEGFLDVVPWWIVFAGIAVAYFKGTPMVIGLGFLALLLTQGRHKKGIVGKLFGGLASWYDITSWLGDILSYCRLMALMLATSVISQVFNILATLPGKGLPKVVGILIFLLIFFIGNAFNMGINIIGTYVHAARLQYLEFFSKFYKEGGVPFRPLKYNTKFVDVTTQSGEVVE
ncbi:MAG: V-type ATP synthase subunit I [Evtepia sp.]|uniref:V-type ATP synthase subunit I n=1 Tax=Evtepia sp. TaxID=2773933 RepID=UPI002A75DF8D|nr:V-type ATP synthase subunit I [Evtepia sp.]MDY3013947.1 V-type ATP synthase subunit I [Evtepia sp.]